MDIKNLDKSHWIISQEEDIIINDWFGFIYEITELDTGRKYIGKKQFKFTKKAKVKNRKNKKTIITESNWKNYTGSSTELNEQIKNKGMKNYKFEIISLHKTKGSLYYAEVQEHVFNDVLRKKNDMGTKLYYNKNISGVKFIPPQELEEEIIINKKLKMQIIKNNN